MFIPFPIVHGYVLAVTEELSSRNRTYGLQSLNIYYLVLQKQFSNSWSKTVVSQKMLQSSV